MVKERTDLVLYTCGTCNLQCRYCGIDKNPILQTIDKALGESFEGDYYFERIKKYFPNRGQLRCIQTWGGEPFLHMERIHPLLRKVIEYYPYFDSMYSSTNFSYSNWTDKVYDLFGVLGEYTYRDFNYCLQLSCDGPEYINDYGRGKGVTKKCLNNFDKFIEQLDSRMMGNINLTLVTKPTLDNNSIKMLCDKQKIIEYYQFFEENFIDKIRTLNYKNVYMDTSIPNTAVPSPVTVEEGQIFAELVKLCREIEKENQDKHYFKYYKQITPYSNNICQTCLSYKYPYHTCGSGTTMVGLLPQNKVSVCHEGFTYLIEDYKKLAANSKRLDVGTINFDKFVAEQRTRYCLTDEEYKQYEEQMHYYNIENTTARLANIVNEIITLALCGQVEPCYMNETNALKAAIFIQGHTSYCVKDNFNQTGSITMVPYGLLKLLLNGALQYIQHEGELKIDDNN